MKTLNPKSFVLNPGTYSLNPRGLCMCCVLGVCDKLAMLSDSNGFGTCGCKD